MTTGSGSTSSTKKQSQAMWVVVLAAVVAGAILLADAFSVTVVQKVSARLGLALLFSAIALLFANGRPAGWVATAILWAAVIISFLV